MNTPPNQLSSERCLQLREQGIIRVLVNLLHEHTFEHEDKSEADFNIELFLMDFNRKAELRARLSQQLRTIVKHTAKNWNELIILGWLETIRKYIGWLYNFMVRWKAMTEDASKLRECTDQLTMFAGQVKQVINQMLKRLTTNVNTHPIFEQFGGVLVIVDYLRAQTRFNSKFHQFESDLIATSPLLRVAKDSRLVMRSAVGILCKFVFTTDSNNDIKLFLQNSRSFHEIMVGIAKDDGHLLIVQLCCCLLFFLYYNHNLRPSTSHLKDSGAIKCLAKFGMAVKDPQTFYYVLMALEFSLGLDRQNVLEFVSIDGAVDMLIDVLVPSKEKDEDVQNAQRYKRQRNYSASALAFIHQNLRNQNGIDEQLLAIFESRDLAAILVRYLEQITSINEYSLTTEGVLQLLLTILVRSEDQRRKFTEIGNGKEVVKRFESSNNSNSARFSKIIGKRFE